MHFDALTVWRFFFISRAGFFRELSAGWVLFHFCASLCEGEHRFLALMVVGIQKIGATTWTRCHDESRLSDWLVGMYELPIKTRTNFLFM